MSMSIDAAAEVMREAMREKVKRHSLWYMFQGALMIVAGILAIAHPAMSSVALVIFFGWLLIISGIAQGISLIDAQRAAFLAAACFGRAVHHRRSTISPQPRRERSHAHAARDRVPDGRGDFKDHLFAHHTAIPERGWILLSGIISVLLSFYLWSSMPVTAVLFLGTLLGISLICEGIALGYLAWRVRQS